MHFINFFKRDQLPSKTLSENNENQDITKKIFGYAGQLIYKNEKNENMLKISGWALDSLNSKLTIDFILDEKSIGKTEQFHERSDIAKLFSSYPRAIQSGFIFRVNIDALELGIHTLQVVCNSKNSKKLIRTLFFAVTQNELNPPKHLTEDVGGDFERVGWDFFSYFLTLGGLKPNQQFLDVGCGCGRIAIPLTKYLKEGNYHGFDINPDAIAWCKENIESKYPNFNFKLIDLYNKRYNITGKINALDFKFPYENESFDFISLTSVFTHLLSQEMEHYLSEIVRVLKTNDKCLITYCLLNSESLANIENKLCKLSFKFKIGNARVHNKKIPEGTVAYDEDFIRELYPKYNLKILEPINFGSWSGRQEFLGGQDIILAEKMD